MECSAHTQSAPSAAGWRQRVSGAIVIQLTPELKDTEAEEAAFERVRQAARNHLDNDAIFDPAKGLDHQYQVPEFTWGPILH